MRGICPTYFPTMSRFSSLSVLLRSRKFHVLPVEGDGNCFYRAVAQAHYKDESFHLLLRRTLMEHMWVDKADYEPYFESLKRFSAVLTANKRAGVWNSDMADLVPMAITKLLSVKVEVYSLEDNEVAKYVFGEEFGGKAIRLLHKDNHYDLLVKN